MRKVFFALFLALVLLTSCSPVAAPQPPIPLPTFATDELLDNGQLKGYSSLKRDYY